MGGPHTVFYKQCIGLQALVIAKTDYPTAGSAASLCIVAAWTMQAIDACLEQRLAQQRVRPLLSRNLIDDVPLPDVRDPRRFLVSCRSERTKLMIWFR